MVDSNTIIEYGAGHRTAFSAAGCFCLFEDQILLVQRHGDKPFGLHWGIPTGKLDAGVTPAQGACREHYVVVGITARFCAMLPINDLLVVNSALPFRYTFFALELSGKPALRLKSDEIRRAEWVDLSAIRNRLAVPFFWDTLHDLIRWRDGEPLQPRLLPTPATKQTVVKKLLKRSSKHDVARPA
jgi:8-oxo-dGTP pyrophosphatase MutT (NUDIX family)